MNVKEHPARGLTRIMQKGFDSELFTYKELRSMFFPLLLDQLFIFLMSMLSTALVSSVGEEAIAAVNMVGSIGFIVSAIFMAVSMGGGIVIAQAKGSGDLEKMRAAIGQTTTANAIVAACLSLLLYMISEPLVNAIYPTASKVLIDYAVHYLRLVCLSQVPYAIFHGIFSSLRSIGDSRSSLVLTVVINAAFLIFSLIFINGMGMGVTGSGLAYITARCIGAVLAVAWLLVVHNTLGMKIRHFFHFQREILFPIIKLGVPFTFEQVLSQGGMLLVQMYLSRWGINEAESTMALAAHGVTSSVFNLYYSVAYAMTAMTSTVCGQCIGAEKIELCKKYCRNLSKVGMAIILVAVAILLPMTPLILKLYHPSAEAVPIIRQALCIAALPMPLIWCWAYVTPTMLRAAGDATYTTVISLLGLLIGRVVLGYVFTIVCNLGVIGIWLGQLVEWMFRLLLMEHRYRSEKWLKYVHLKRAASDT